MSLYTFTTQGAVALTGATAKSVLGVKAPSGHGVDLCKYRVSFDGVRASALPVLVEICYCTWATNGPGTNSTLVTIHQVRGRVIAPTSTAAANWTREPTVLTVLDLFLLTPAGGLVIYDFPLGDEFDSAVSEGFAIRCTAPAAVNVRASMWYKRA